MGRYLAAALLGVLYITGSVWLVRREGAAYREGLRLARSEPPATIPTPVSPPPVAPPKPPPTLTAHVAPIPPAPVPSAPAPPPMTPTATPTPEPRPAVSVPPPEPTPTAARPQTWADSLNLARLSTDDERRLGAELHTMVLTLNPQLDTGPWLRRVVEAARPLLDARTRKEIDYTFTILNTDAVTAFSHPGGYVYVGRGLFDLIGVDEDYALEFVLAHEIAHVDLKHAVKCLEKVDPRERQRGLGVLEQFYLLIGFGYPDAQEFEADAWAYRQLIRRDRTRREALAFLRKFQGYAELHGFVNGRMPPSKDDKAPAVENHFRAHPAAWDRLGRLKDQADKAGAGASIKGS